jgi:hypothetical protein
MRVCYGSSWRSGTTATPQPDRRHHPSPWLAAAIRLRLLRAAPLPAGRNPLLRGGSGAGQRGDQRRMSTGVPTST